MSNGIWSHVQHPTGVVGSGASLSRAFQNPVQQHSLLIACATTDSTPGQMTFSSTGSPAWASFTSYKDPTTQQWITIGYCLDAPSGNTTVRCDFNGTSSAFLSLHISEFNNTALSQTLDAHTNGQSSTGTTHTDGTMTVTGNDLIISCYIAANAGAGNCAVGSGFSQIVVNDANIFNSEYELNITSNIAGVFTNSVSVAGGIMSAAFKAGTVATGGGGNIVAPTIASGAISVIDPIPQFMKSGNTVRFQYERLDKDENSLGFMTNVFSSDGNKISYQYLSTIKRTATFTLLDFDQSQFAPTSDRVRPWMGVLMPDGSWADMPLGVFLLSTPTKHVDNGAVTWAAQGYDKNQIPVDNTITNISTYGGYYLPAGTIYTDAIRSLLNQSGIPDSQISLTPSTLTLPVDRTWKQPTAQQVKDDPKGTAESTFKAHNRVWTQGTNAAGIISDLLVAINYGSLWFDAYGVAQVHPYIQPSADAVDHTYVTSEGSIVWPTIDQTLDLFAVPNTIVFVVSQPDRPVLTSKFVNSDPSSPVSTVNRGRKVVRFDNTLDVATQSELDSHVKQAAIDAANIYEHISFFTLPMPNHGDRDIIWLTYDPLGVSAAYAEIAWDMELKPGGQMGHEVRKVVNIDASLLGDPDIGT